MFRLICLICSILVVSANSLKYPITAYARTDSGDGRASGIVNFEQTEENGPVSMSLRFIGLTTGMHGFHIHENGVRDNDCLTAGSHYNPQGNSHSGKSNILYRHLGDLGNVMADNKGEIHMEVVDSLIQLHGPSTIIGRSFVLHAKRDDLGLGGDEESKKTGNAGARIACGTILLH